MADSRKYLTFANLQMAAEAFLQDAVQNPANLRTRVIAGNGRTNMFPDAVADQFVSDFEVIAHRTNTTTGFSGTLFRAKVTDIERGLVAGQLTLSFRSTEFVDDAVRDAKSFAITPHVRPLEALSMIDCDTNRPLRSPDPVAAASFVRQGREGNSYPFAAVLISTGGGLLAQRNHQRGLHGWPAMAWSMGYGALASLAAALVLGRDYTIDLGWPYLLSLLYLSVYPFFRGEQPRRRYCPWLPGAC